MQYLDQMYLSCVLYPLGDRNQRQISREDQPADILEPVLLYNHGKTCTNYLAISDII